MKFKIIMQDKTYLKYFNEYFKKGIKKNNTILCNVKFIFL